MTTAARLFTPDFKEAPYWWEDAAPLDMAGGQPDEADVAIVGGGYAGLSTALELARNGAKVVVLEAEALGFGASTRNGGAVSGGVNVGKGRDLAAELGKERLARLLEDASAAYGHMESVIAREAIDCRYAQTGRFTAAHTRVAYEGLARRAEALNAHAQSAVEMVPRAEQQREVATAAYHGGMIVRRAGSVHPSLLHRGLVEACRRHGATLVSHARVDAIARSGDRFVLQTRKGTLRAKEVVIATNGYTDAVARWQRRRLIPVASYMIATEELPAETVRALIPNLRTISDTKRILYYYRPSPDGRRILFGGRAKFTQVDHRTSAGILHGFLCEIFPQLRDVRISHAWSGNVAFTFDRLPHMGMHDGLHYCMGCNGSGVVMMMYLGHRVARKILGGGERPCAFDELPFPTHAFYDGRPWFLPVVGTYYRVRDWLDRATD